MLTPERSLTRTVSLNLHRRETHGLYYNGNFRAACYSTAHVQPPTHPVLIPNTKARHHPHFPGGKSSSAGTTGPTGPARRTNRHSCGNGGGRAAQPPRAAAEVLLCSKAGNRLKREKKRSPRPGPARRPPGDAVPHQRHLPAAPNRGRPAPPPSRHAPRGGHGSPSPWQRVAATRGARPHHLPSQILKESWQRFRPPHNKEETQ